MQYIKELSGYQDSRKTAVTFGKFDGLHRGHQKLVGKVRELAEEHGLVSIVCAFDMKPLWKCQGKQPPLLMVGKEKYKHLKTQVDYFVECPFTKEFSQISAEGFIKNIINGLFHADYVVVGTDFHFGYEKRGDIQMLEQYAQEYGYELLVIEKERYGKREISSTYIKEVISQGEVDLAAKMLGYPYQISGVVEHGRKLGRTLGFPTLNVTWPNQKIVPKAGVYFSRVSVEGMWYYGVSNVGIKPTVTNEKKLLIETFLFDYSEEAYGKETVIELLKFHREEQKFESIEEMKEHVDKDIEYGRHFFGMDK